MVAPTVPTVTFRCPHCNTPVEVDPRGDAVICPVPGCGKPFQVAVPRAKPAERDRVAGPAPAAASSGPAQPPAAIPVQALTAAPPQEQVIETVQVAMVRRYPGRVLAYVALTVALAAAAAYLGSAGWTLVSWLVVAGAAVVLGKLLLWWLRMRNTLLMITNRRLVLETGVLTREAMEFDLDNLRDVLVHQGVLMRLCNVGDLTLVSDNGNKRQVVVMAVPDPETVATRIRDLREAEEHPPPPPPA